MNFPNALVRTKESALTREEKRTEHGAPPRTLQRRVGHLGEFRVQLFHQHLELGGGETDGLARVSRVEDGHQRGEMFRRHRRDVRVVVERLHESLGVLRVHVPLPLRIQEVERLLQTRRAFAFALHHRLARLFLVHAVDGGEEQGHEVKVAEADVAEEEQPPQAVLRVRAQPHVRVICRRQKHHHESDRRPQIAVRLLLPGSLERGEG